ncbi:unnamed protein product [Urochloa decumbens]|uniref:Protein kinase domain-containing protein n=1 Tax=Urochloa decumbens TaxID=240449 RepID=A0ABC9DFW0_9POAL
MASAASRAPGKPLLVLISLVTLLLFLLSAVEGYDGRHAAAAHSAVARRSRLGMGMTRHTHHHRRRRTAMPHRYHLAEKQSNSTTTGGGAKNGSAPATSGAASSPAPAPPGKHHRSHKHRVRNWIIGFVVGSVAGVISGLVLSVLFRLALNCIRGRYRTRSGVTIFTPKLIRRADHLAFLEKDDGLASLAVIGRGGCGEVYKAQLPVDREGEEPRYIAIKKIKKHGGAGEGPNNLSDEESRQLDKWSRQIQSEIRTVGHIRHRNLLPLAAHVPRPDCHYLVYEYMKNGSLHQALKPAAAGDSSSGVVALPWPARLRVAVGVAEGLEYLHESHRPQIIHRDLKPANILLDDDLEPRIADFGLAKAMPDQHTHVTASNLAGTWGYIAPEYHQTLKFTAKCDVYSFGVILAVLATGKEPSDDFFKDVDEVGIVRWLRRVVQSGDHAEAIDPAIAGAGHDEQIVLVLRIAVFCTNDDPKERPTAKDVRCMLSQIKN